MGTSSSYTAPTTGSWPTAKRMATRFARQGGTGAGPVTPDQVIRSYIVALGGAAAAVAGAIAGRSVASRLGGFLTAASGQGLGTALQEQQLSALVGQDTTDVLQGLVDHLAGPGRTLEEAAARSALLVVLSEEFEQAGTFAEMEALCTQKLDADGVLRFLERFLEEYVYHRMVEELGDRLANGAITSADACKVEQDIHAFIVAHVRLELAYIDPLTLDWEAPEAQQLVDRLLTLAYEQLG